MIIQIGMFEFLFNAQFRIVLRLEVVCCDLFVTFLAHCCPGRH